MRKTVGDLINDFDALDDEDKNVKTFNDMFPTSKLGKWIYTIDGITEFEEYPSRWSVEIGEITKDDCRVITLCDKIQVTHKIRQSFKSNGPSKGRFTPVTVDSIKFEGIRIASRHFGLSIDQFHRKFIKTQEGIYERRNPRTNSNITIPDGADEL
jgi:hypothetical protein